MLALRGVGRLFGTAWAVRGLSLHVAPGEVFALLGPNGAGKTTTVKMLAGLLSPTEGRVLIGGHDIVREPVRAKSLMGYVPDRAFFYEKLTVMEFLRFAASLYGVPGESARERIPRLVETFELGEVEHALIESCSQGMRQRLLFAAALVHEPRAFLIDEPIVGLDPFGVALVKDVIRRLAEGGAAVFLATHSLPVAADLAHRVGLIDRGGLIALKDREEVGSLRGGLEELFMRELGRGR